METKNLLLVGGARNKHGTRIARKIQCQRCGQEDHITSRPSKTSGAFCRACAQQEMNAFEVGKKWPKQVKQYVCTNCQSSFELSMRVEVDKGCLCPSCLRGYDTWRGTREMSVEERESMVLEKRESGVVVRKKA